MKLAKKIRLCRGCGNEGNLISGFCEVCNGEGFISPAPRVPKVEKKEPERKPIKKVSDNRAKENREYLKLRKVFLEERGSEFEDGLPRCEGMLEGCTGIATEVQHSHGKENERLLEVEYFKASCHNCNMRAESHPLEAQAKGFSILRTPSL